MRKIYAVLLFCGLNITLTYAADVGRDYLIPRKVIFGNPDKVGADISNDGSKIAFMVSLNKLAGIWVMNSADIRATHARPITQKIGGIASYCWSYNNNYILYAQDQSGDENFHIYSLHLKTGKIKDLTPFKKAKAQIIGMSDLFPNEILVVLNKRDPRWNDVYRVNIISGKLTLVEENHQFVGFTTDRNLQVRIALKYKGKNLEHHIKNSEGRWEFYEKISFEDERLTTFIGFNKEGNIAYKIDSQGRDTAAIYTVNINTKKKTFLAGNNKADCSGLLIHHDGTIQAYSYEYTKTKWVVLDRKIKKDFAYLKKIFSDNFVIETRSLADDKWIVRYYSDTKPSGFYLYKRDPLKNQPLSLSFLFTTRNDLANISLAPMAPLVLKARDGLELVSYLTLPLTAKTRTLPMVLFVHGGPLDRDSWRMHPYHQWLANRGYAVLSVNYRGSTGFGKAFINAGNKEWGGKMQDDLIDAVNWAVKNKIADPGKIAIMGYSYGGYAALAGLTFTPDVFRCGVSINGPANLVTFLKTMPPYWQSAINFFKQYIGDPDTVEGRELLLKSSPFNYVKRIKKPLLILQGENDPRVKKIGTDQFVAKMKKNGIPVTYVVYHDEGHGIAKEQNSLSAHAIIEKFLAQNLGGRYEDVKMSVMARSRSQ